MHVSGIAPFLIEGKFARRRNDQQNAMGLSAVCDCGIF